MKRKLLNIKGFTLIEIISSLIIIMIISVIAGMGLIEMSKGYVFYKKNSSTAQQGQIAMTRLKKEFSNIHLITSSSASSITYKRCQDNSPPCGTLKDVTLSWAGSNSPLLIDSDILAAPVISFSIAYFDSYSSSASSYSSSTSIIEITIQLRGAEDIAIEFKDRVNLYLETGG